MEVGRPPRRLKRLSPPAAGPRPDGDLHRGDRGSICLFLAPRAGLGRRGTEPQASGRKKGNRKPRASSQGTPGSPGSPSLQNGGHSPCLGDVGPQVPTGRRRRRILNRSSCLVRQHLSHDLPCILSWSSVEGLSRASWVGRGELPPRRTCG